MIGREKRHRASTSPCECRRGFVPYRPLPKPWHAALDWMQLVCSVFFGLMGWVALFGAVSDALLAGGSLLGAGLLLCAVFWSLAGVCGYWSVLPLFEVFEVSEEEEE